VTAPYRNQTARDDDASQAQSTPSRWDPEGHRTPQGWRNLSHRVRAAPPRIPGGAFRCRERSRGLSRSTAEATR